MLMENAAELQRFQVLFFCKLLRTAVSEKVRLLDRLCSLDNFSHSVNQITLSEKMLIIATRRNGKLHLLASLLQYGTEE